MNVFLLVLVSVFAHRYVCVALGHMCMSMFVCLFRSHVHEYVCVFVLGHMCMSMFVCLFRSHVHEYVCVFVLGHMCLFLVTCA